MRRFFLFFQVVALFALSACAEVELGSHVAKQALPSARSQGTFKVGTPYKVEGKRYYPEERYDLVETGIASWYGSDFHGKQTANGETFDMYELTAAHRTLQMPSLVRVTNLENGRSLIVRVNDRGPYKRSRVMDVSMRAAELLGFKAKGTAKVRLEVLKDESMKIAAAAKSGVDTSGYEMALNNGGGRFPRIPEPVQPAYVQTAAVQRETLATAIPGHTKGGEFYPDPVVTEEPVTPSNIYIQAGSFTVADNAYRLSASLQSIGQASVQPVTVGNRQYFRVRIGPAGTVEAADELLARVVAAGQDSAIVIVE